MNRKTLYALWGVLFIVCAGLGFIPEPEGALALILKGAALLFFLPPALLLWQARQSQDLAEQKRIHRLSALSLGVTLVLILANFLAAPASEFWGTVLHCILVIVSSPMICGGQWALSLFLWACLLTASRSPRQRK